MTRERPACKTHANSISTGSPMQLRTNCRGHSPAPSSVSPVKLRTNRRPHAPAPSSVSPVKPRTNPHQPPAPSCANPVKLRSKRHPICLSPGSCGNPVHLRITRVGQATCHQCAEIRRVADGRGLENIVPANIEQKRALSSRLSQQNPCRRPPPCSYGMRTRPMGTRSHRTRADLPCLCMQAGDGILDVLALASGRVCPHTPA